MIVRYFVVKPDQAKDYKAVLMADEDVLLLDVFVNAMEIYRDVEKVVLLVRIDADTITELQDQTDCEDPLNLEAVVSLKITNTYISTNRGSVTLRWPELDGQIQVGEGEDGNPIMEDILSRCIWV